MGKIPDRWAPRGRATSRRRSIPPEPLRAVKPSRSSRVLKPVKKPGSSRRRPSMDVIEGITRWLPFIPIGRRISGTRLIAFKVPLKNSYVRRLEPRHQFTVESLLDRVPELGLVIDLTQTDRYYNKQDFLMRGVHYCKIPCPGQQIPPEDLVIRFFNAVDYYLDHHAQDNTLIGVHCTHGVNRTGYMLARYLVQRLGIPVREAVMCITNARSHDIERKHYVSELERHTNLVPKESSDKDIQFSRMRPGPPTPMAGLSPPPAGRLETPPPQTSRSDNWRPDKIKPHKPPPPSVSPGRSSFNGQLISEGRNKEPREMPHKFPPGPGWPPMKEGMEKFVASREKLREDKDPMRAREDRSSRSREREMRSSYSTRRSRSRERDICAPRGMEAEDRIMPRDSMRGGYEDRYRNRPSPPPQHFQDRPVIEEARRNYRADRPEIPLSDVEKSRAYPEGYMREPARDRSPNMGDISYEHPDRMERYGEEDRFRNDRRSFTEYDRQRIPREDTRAPPAAHFSGRYTPSPPPYARGAMEPGASPFIPNRRPDEPGRQFEPDLPVGGRRMESDMPVGGRRMNEGIADGSPPRMQPGEDPRIIRGRMDDIHSANRARINEEMAMMRVPMDIDRQFNREMGDQFRDRREFRRSPSPRYIDNFGPRGGEVPPYGMAPHIPERFGSPMRPIADSDMRRIPGSPPLRQAFSPPRRPHSPARRPHSPPRRPHSPARRPHSPPRRPHSPARRPLSPPRRPLSPPRRPLSPPRRPHSPPRRPHSPPRRPISPPRRQVSPPRRALSPPRRPMIPPGRSLSPLEIPRAVGPPYRDYSPSRRDLPSPQFRCADEPPPPGIEAEIRREMEERERMRSPARAMRRSRRSRSKSGGRGKMRRSVSPRKLRASKQRELAGNGRVFSPPDTRGRHHPDERMGAGWSPGASPSRCNAPPGQPGGSREVWIDDHPPIRNRIDDGPDCRLIINKKRSSVFPEENEPVSRRGGGPSSGREERRLISPPRGPPSIGDRDRPPMNIDEEMREREHMIGRMNSMRGGGRGGPGRSGGPGERMRGGPPGRMGRGGPRHGGEHSKKPVFERLDRSRRGAWPR